MVSETFEPARKERKATSAAELQKKESPKIQSTIQAKDSEQKRSTHSL